MHMGKHGPASAAGFLPLTLEHIFCTDKTPRACLPLAVVRHVPLSMPDKIS